jgi:hypothetical protein
MERGKILINENGVKITPESGNVWLSEWQIAKLFEVFEAKVSRNIRSILKSEVLRVNEVCHYHRYTNGGGVDLYNLEMITALSFHIKSRNSEIFRNWLMKRAISKPYSITEQLCNESRKYLN